MAVVVGLNSFLYQTLINATLREAMRGHQIADELRQIIREELRHA